MTVITTAIPTTTSKIPVLYKGGTTVERSGKYAEVSETGLVEYNELVLVDLPQGSIFPESNKFWIRFDRI